MAARAGRPPGYPRPMTADRFSVPAADGRTLDVLACGPADGLPFVFHSGTPSGLVAYDPMTEAAAALGLRTVIYSRPGYGGSAPHPGRLVADAAADVTAILDHVGAGPFVTAGWSGGGPHALACAALLPGRCLAAASIAGVAPYGGAGLDWLGDMGPENVQEFTAAANGDAALASLLEKGSDELRDITAAELAAGLGGLLSEADNAVISGEFAEYLAASFRAAVATGTAGWRGPDGSVCSRRLAGRPAARRARSPAAGRRPPDARCHRVRRDSRRPPRPGRPAARRRPAGLIQRRAAHVAFRPGRRRQRAWLGSP